MKVIMESGRIMESSFKEEVGCQALRRTASHVLAQAVKRLYPTAKRAMGEVQDNGFYYDFEFQEEFTFQQLLEVEHEMKNIIKESSSLEYLILEKEEVMAELYNCQEKYLLEILTDMKDKDIAFIQQGDYTELCKGDFVRNTNIVKAVKLTGLAGAYWRGDEKGPMLTRIYGTAFSNESDLNEYITKMEEVKARDHRRIGKELELFTFMEEGPGFPFFLPKGIILKNLLLDYWRKIHDRNNYVEVSSPMILKRDMWETSGHWDNYKETMYTTQIDDVDYAIKPMNCPGGMLVYKMKPHSYKELPIRMGELGVVHRHEKSGTLHGLMRVRAFTQDDAHIFMMREQVTDEIKNVVRLIDEVYTKFGFPYMVELSTRPEISIGSDEDWKDAIESLKLALEEMKLPYTINEGDGAFYGPKIDFHLKDSIGRTWQCGTIQLDFQLPQRFHAEYIGADGEKHQPIMIHRVIFGSIERFIGILIEHYAGKFPVWLAPVQVKILPISNMFMEYSMSILDQLKRNGIRCEIDTRDEKLGFKIREARLDRVPYMIVIGKNEQEEKLISLRGRDEGDLGTMELDQLIRRLVHESNICITG